MTPPVSRKVRAASAPCQSSSSFSPFSESTRFPPLRLNPSKPFSLGVTTPAASSGTLSGDITAAPNGDGENKENEEPTPIELKHPWPRYAQQLLTPQRSFTCTRFYIPPSAMTMDTTMAWGSSEPVTPVTQTTATEASDSDSEYLLTPDPRNSNDFTNDWNLIPTRQRLWRPPSRAGVRRSERLRRRNRLPGIQEELERLQEQQTKPLYYCGLSMWWLLLLAFLPLLLLVNWYDPPTESLSIPVVAPQLHCFLSPLCPAWAQSREKTTRTLITRTTQHVASTNEFMHATLNRVAKLQANVQSLSSSLRAEATLQTSLARSFSEHTSADTSESLSHALQVLSKDLASTQASINTQIIAATKLLRRFGGFLLQQSGRRDIPWPNGWDRNVPTIQSFALESTLKSNYAGFLTRMRMLCRNVASELLHTREKVIAVLQHVEEVVEDGNLGDVHSSLVGQLKLLLRALKDLRERQLRVWAEGLVNVPWGGEDEEESASLAETFAQFYIQLADLEGGVMGLRRGMNGAETNELPTTMLGTDQMTRVRTAVEPK